MVDTLAGSDPTPGSVSANADSCEVLTFGNHSRFCSSEPNSNSGCANPIDWCADSSVDTLE